MADQVIGVLEATLSPDANVRTQAELQLSSIHAEAECGSILADALLAAQLPMHIRQAAGINLRKWVNERWSPQLSAYIGLRDPSGSSAAIATPPELKSSIRAKLLEALKLREKPLRLAAAYALSAASAPDWPDDAPELLPSIQQLLDQQSSSNVDAVHGAMAFLSDFVSGDLDENQIVAVSRQLLPSLERVLGADQQYSGFVRARAVLVFRHLLETLFMVRESYPEASQATADEVLPRWLAALEGIVVSAQASLSLEVLGLQEQIWKTLKVALNFRSHIKPYIARLTNIAVSNLAQLTSAFTAAHVSPSEDGPSAAGSTEGDSDVSSDVPRLASQILDFVTSSIRLPSAKSALLHVDSTTAASAPPPALASLVESLRSFSRMTREDEEEWSSDIGAFVAASDDEEGLGWALRGSCADALGGLLEDAAQPTLGCLQRVAESTARHVSDTHGPDVWKESEAALALFGGVAEAVLEHKEEDAAGSSCTTAGALDLGNIFTTMVLPNMSLRSGPFLLGRCFVFASQYASALPPPLAAEILEAAVRSVEDNSSDGAEGDAIIKLSAVRCIKNFYRHLDAQAVRPYSARVVSRLGPLLAVTTTSTLVLIVETLQLVATQSQDEHGGTNANGVPAGVYAEVINATLTAWCRDAKDHVLLSVVEDMLELLAGGASHAHAHAVTSSALAALSQIVKQKESGNVDSEGAVLAAGSFELMAATLRGASSDTLSHIDLSQEVLPALVATLTVSDDRDILQRGVECLTHLVRKATQQTLAWTEPGTGTTSIQKTLAIVARLLEPADEFESGGLAVGDLLIALLRKAPQAVVEVLPDLLRALVTRLASVRTSAFAQSLIVPFAYLMLEQATTVIELLEGFHTQLASESSGSGQTVSGLEVLARRWVEHAETIQGFWAQRVSSIALTRLLEANRPILSNVIVQGDLLPDNSNIIRTRSKAKTMPHKYSQIPISAKMLKLLLSDWQHARRGPPGPSADDAADGARTPETDDEDGEWDDEEDYAPKRGALGDIILSDVLGPTGFPGYGEDDLFDLNGPEDPDLASDEVYNMDAKAYLSSFLRSQIQLPDANARYAPYLSSEEQQVARAATGV
ncbi:ARM repeat-containing protein [Ceraceosorus guamensis]|uniref:ARM repeat-containing protein n=1 Tax=Ceraceosorus guamensis TaxID=1522189 RepID=A0A316W4W5_9BASI|nr:ARM repeat-containing protein [Ceraceosorus guamensis]PWN44604.1 ARM repeat-containing protein [Ceraceosorus guamensis]